ncbi:multidrug resistance-associated protein 9 [Prunus dulcis]|uniref:Multidrug resistance-associated protein 9 n=1 Tax=Prunus dulcis TaxID=3755 RepID=A0A4Y1S0W6_PRUDU|nr:multidrug resistance-associated protein 9 [Prunus dulcis]
MHEEESDQDWPNKRLTLDGSAKKREELPLSSRLEMLKAGAHVDACNLKDDVSSGDEKDDVHSIGKEDGSYTWSAASKEVEELMRSNEKKSCSSSHSSYLKLNKSSKGTESRQGKPKFLFRFPIHKEGHSWLSVYKDDNDVSFKVEEENQLDIVPFEVNEHGHGCIEQSMAELLDGLQDKTTVARGSSKMCLLQYSRKICKRRQPVLKRVPRLGDRLIDSESSPEHLGPESPSDSEYIQILYEDSAVLHFLPAYHHEIPASECSRLHEMILHEKSWGRSLQIQLLESTPRP